MKKGYAIFILSIFLSTHLISFTQKENVNQSIYKIHNLIESGDRYKLTSLDTALIYYQRAISIAESFKLRNYVAESLEHIGTTYEKKGIYDTAIEYYQKALNVYRELNDRKGIANNIGNMGDILYYQSNYSKALKLYQEALTIDEEIGNKKGIANNLGNIGNIFYYRNDYTKALHYYEKTLEIQKSINNTNGIANSFINIGNIYSYQENYNKALEYYQKAMTKYKEVNNKIGLALVLGNIGIVYSNRNNYNIAIEYYQKALEINMKIDNQRGRAYNLIELAELSCKLRRIDNALLYVRKGLAIAKNIGSLKIQENAYSCLSDIYEEKRLFHKAIEYKDSVIHVNDSIFSIERTKAIAEMEVRYETEKKEKQILEQVIELRTNQIEIQRGKIEKEEKKNQRNIFISGFIFLSFFVLLILHQYHQKLKINNLLRKQKKKLICTNDLLSQTNEELAVSLETVSMQSRQIKESEEKLKTLSNSAKDVIILVDNDEKISMWNKAAQKTFGYTKEEVIHKNIHDLITPVKYRNIAHKSFASFRLTGKGNAINKTLELEGIRKNGEAFPIELSLSAINTRGQWSALGIIRDISERKKYEKYLIDSKKRIEQLYKDLTDNINYAKALQQTLLTSEHKIRKYLNDYFMMFLPRNQVSGDFYYVNKYDRYLIIAVADSTGHGVSGGFLTVLGITYLHEIISNKNYAPEVILELFREKIKRTFRNKNNDGYDIALCVIDTETNVLEFAGAFNPLWIIRNEKLMEIKATRNPIGTYLKEVQFKKKSIQLEDNDLLYMFTDGYIDQFGSSNNKKFKTKRLRELIVNISGLSMNEQKSMLKTVFEEWKAGYEQTDDVTIFGLRYKLFLSSMKNV